MGEVGGGGLLNTGFACHRKTLRQQTCHTCQILTWWQVSKHPQPGYGHNQPQLQNIPVFNKGRVCVITRVVVGIMFQIICDVVYMKLFSKVEYKHSHQDCSGLVRLVLIKLTDQRRKKTIPIMHFFLSECNDVVSPAQDLSNPSACQTSRRSLRTGRCAGSQDGEPPRTEGSQTDPTENDNKVIIKL